MGCGGGGSFLLWGASLGTCTNYIWGSEGGRDGQARHCIVYCLIFGGGDGGGGGEGGLVS